MSTFQPVELPDKIHVGPVIDEGHSLASVMSPNCTPPPYDRMLTPTPMLPDCGTQNRVCRKVEPHSFSGLAGPGTLVITAVAFLANRLSSASCAGLISKPATDNSANATQNAPINQSN